MGTYTANIMPFGNYRGGAVIVLAEADENEAMSITNNIEKAAMSAVIIAGLEWSRCLFVEYYPPNKILRLKEQFDLVQFSLDRTGFSTFFDPLNLGYLSQATSGQSVKHPLIKLGLVAYSPSWVRVTRDWCEKLTGEI